MRRIGRTTGTLALALILSLATPALTALAAGPGSGAGPGAPPPGKTPAGFGVAGLSAVLLAAAGYLGLTQQVVEGDMRKGMPLAQVANGAERSQIGKDVKTRKLTLAQATKLERQCPALVRQLVEGRPTGQPPGGSPTGGGPAGGGAPSGG